MYEVIEFSLEDGVARIELNRPERLNAINRQLLRELTTVLATLRASDEVRTVVVQGRGRAFSAGADISELVDFSGAPAFLQFIEEIQRTFDDLESFACPTIAALNGFAFGGGCELSLACDFRIMAEDAEIGVPEIKIGVLPGAGGTQRLPRLLPPAVAKRMVLFGEPLSAQDALRFGLVNEVVPRDEVAATALSWARRLAELPPHALRTGKLLANLARNVDVKSGVEAERQAVAFLFGTEDRKEGMQAFLEKRQPRFSGR